MSPLSHLPSPRPNYLYLDAAATSPLLPAARAAMTEVFDTVYGNPSALHTPGQAARAIIEQARAEVAALIHARPEEIIFTSGGTEANNTVIHTFAGQRVAVSNIEHPSLLQPARKYTDCTLLPVDARGHLSESTLEAAISFHYTTLPVKSQEETASNPENPAPNLKNSLKFPISLVSVMLANNELGTIQPIRALAKLAHAHGAYFHTDATQALGKIPLNVRALDVDYLTISAHKIGGPVGVGALYIRGGPSAIKAYRKSHPTPGFAISAPADQPFANIPAGHPLTYTSGQPPLAPLLLGGHQENRLRAGTTPVAQIAGFGAAARYARTHHLPRLYAEKVRPLRDYLARQILAQIPHASLNTPLPLASTTAVSPAIANAATPASPITASAADPATIANTTTPATDAADTATPTATDSTPTLPHLLNVSFPAAEGESIQLYLDTLARVAVSTGSACASGDGQPSHVLMATTGDAEVAHGSVRFSLTPDTTREDLDYVMQYLPSIVKYLQSISTLKLKSKGIENVK